MFHSELIPGRSKFVVWWCVSLSMRLSKWLLVYLHETRIKIGMKKGIDNLYYLATLQCDAMPGGDVRLFLFVPSLLPSVHIKPATTGDERV